MKKHPLQHMTKQTKIGIAIALVLAAAAGGLFWDTYYGGGRIRSLFVSASSSSTEGKEGNGVLSTIELDVGSQSSFAVFGKAFLHCTKDGIKYYDSAGVQKWSDTFTMTSPKLIQEGSYMAVGDMNGKTLRVYGQSGMLYQIQLEGSLTQFALNTNGYLSLVEKRANGSQILVYNNAGTLLKGRVEESAGIYPVSTDISDDNKSFAVSYVDTSDVKIMGKVLFFYINSTDSENVTDSMFASVMKENEVMGTVSYGNGALRAVSDKGLYGFGTDGVEKWAYSFTNLVDYISFQNKDTVALVLGDAAAGQESRPSNTICWVDGSGKETASYESDREITYFSVWEDGVIAGSQSDFAGLRHTGSEEWTYQATQEVSQMVPMEKFTKVLVVMQDRALILDMTKNTEGAGLADLEAPEIEGVVVVDEMAPAQTQDSQTSEEGTDAAGTEEGTDGAEEQNGETTEETPEEEEATGAESTEETMPEEGTEPAE
ncbi:hypothetical protein H9X85_12445 [Anaerotignum lactatifermentans]|uniref:Uncharacterized protein n=1 Tax=Anaerotignum lactatifermentans TaxID=160404 RepID=A0ABS2GCR6_9FIRM|nr:DUF5711 family protein [Anaerotignum lactatifermentans]MBM6830412.1 hypothetical protein [Anaerotignum lactatifermentans]MBM6878945.1 hypothetical protein [Anaerotignum lactatifermentans]MBM6951989.1 hypothetical protein [Anaerotignum lactatifermentans]